MDTRMIEFAKVARFIQNKPIKGVTGLISSKRKPCGEIVRLRGVGNNLFAIMNDEDFEKYSSGYDERHLPKSIFIKTRTRGMTRTLKVEKVVTTWDHIKGEIIG